MIKPTDKLDDLELTDEQREKLEMLRGMGVELETVADVQQLVAEIIRIFKPVIDQLGVAFQNFAVVVNQAADSSPEIRQLIDDHQAEQRLREMMNE